jgi:hypothetical protein
METVIAINKCQLSRKLFRYCFAVLLAMSASLAFPVNAQQEEDVLQEEALIKSAFVFNFAKFTSWPEYTWDFNNTEFFLCTVGKDDVAKTLNGLTGELLNKRVVQVLNFDEDAVDNACNLVYIANDPSVNLAKFLKSHCCESILTVSDIKGFALSGGMIEMYTDSKGSVQFKINRNRVILSGLNISSRLLSLAEIVKEEQP